MSSPFAAAIAAAAEAAPMSNGLVPILQGRLLGADGDGLAYYCAGNDDTEPGEARQRLIDKLDSACRACGAESAIILATARGSHKGYRYAIARAKPYQGHRDGKRRPKNWEYLRSLMDDGFVGRYPVEFTNAEADDLFARYSRSHPDFVIYTQDKDMRMVPGIHLDWLTHIMFTLPPTSWAATHNDKLWGRKWFWLQMLMGDSADNIPGLPGFVPKPGAKTKKVGEVTASTLLDNLSSDAQCCIHVGALYESYYGERWMVEMLEQGILLWMRNDAESDPFNVAAEGNPLHAITTHDDWAAAHAEVQSRINEARSYAAIEDHGSGDAPECPAVTAEHEVCAVPSPVQSGQCSVGPRPFDGSGAGITTPGMQRPVGQSGEQPSPVRGGEPPRLPAWMRALLAKAQ